MPAPWILALSDSMDPSLVGGKAAGLGRLIRRKFSVPPGVCLTTAAYRSVLADAGLDPSSEWSRLCQMPAADRSQMAARVRDRIASLRFSDTLLDQLHAELARFPETRWAVRSSASNEDGSARSFAGIYQTVLGASRDDLPAAIRRCWASLWSETSFAYQAGADADSDAAPSMAVILQPLVPAQSAGVAYSCHPVDGRRDCVVINAVPGLADSLVSGAVTPDQFIIRTVPAGHGAIQERTLVNPDKPSLDDAQAVTLAMVIRDVERTHATAVDVEWIFDGRQFWLVQARPIARRPAAAAGDLSEADCVWSRANFKETLPDAPSPLALSYMQDFMETNILRHYREAGCRIPAGLSSVRIHRGRPYINVTLFQFLTAQLGNDPALVTEQMGGEAPAVSLTFERLPWWRLLPAGVSLLWKVWTAPWKAPSWFDELRTYGRLFRDDIEAQDDATLERHLEAWNQRGTDRDLTFAIVSGVAQSLSVLGLLLNRRAQDWRPLLNQATQGLGTIISANQIARIAEFTDIARSEATVREFLVAEPWQSGTFRIRLAGTRFLAAFDAFMDEYGHRAVGESDVMAPRFAETPAYHLGIVRAHLRAGMSLARLQKDQEQARGKALSTLRKAFGWRLHEWLWFRAWHRFLCRYLALREANRHYTMYYVAVVRRLLLVLGGRLAARGVLTRADDLFFLTADELTVLQTDPDRDWKGPAARRREEWHAHAAMAAPDTLRPGAGHITSSEPSGDVLKGTPISAGYAEGPVRLVRSPEDFGMVQKGDILVVPVIDPGMAPLFMLAAGLIAEMGGTLSHGAIIAREYGIPAVANVQGAITMLKNGDRTAVDAKTGMIRRA